ncbi:PLP-dependent aminotransferase family protein [Paenibacillus radicis (ex Xue et al. 2023)]|uniref:PLP-dependent aminotransferase family protein n=1 Tax=Paenibacillus radicis (ex Xue et al. 2023) TaxID=2972489 RepID=A0ABT1Y974_9BACL|nr:PLP-dependent aminotransferase family protein [Paenibacillus radicis (ex Xue et al. 2023)]MCR8629739.1 PLP-dependent aminotransferase family protein [Paenibacillus radicis (ex Xue et al. 2023)]
MHFQIPYHSYYERYSTKLLAFYHALRDSIVDGVLPLHTKLPSSRELAALYNVSRGTINQVYDMLASEGYVVCEVGRGTFISYNAGSPNQTDMLKRNYSLSQWGTRINEISAAHEASVQLPLNAADAGVMEVDFHWFAPDSEWFPKAEWNRCLYATARQISQQSPIPPPSVQGDIGLREAIANYLRRARGIAAPAEQIVIFNGSMQAIALLAQLMINDGDIAVVENPGYNGIRRAVIAAGGTCMPVDVDQQGIMPDDWAAKLLFVTPGRQFPTGAVLSLERRQQLLQWAYEREAVIIEDDYDSEFRHRGRAVEPLKVLDREERVVYVGSFSKTLPSSIRIGYAVMPQALVGPASKAKALYEPQPTGLLEQQTLASFMNSGEYERHLRRMKRVYSRKFECLHRLLTGCLSDRFAWVESDAGLHLFGWWLGTEDYTEFRKCCGSSGIRWSDLALQGDGGTRYGAYFHFAHLTEHEMEYAVKLMQSL